MTTLSRPLIEPIVAAALREHRARINLRDVTAPQHTVVSTTRLEGRAA